MIFSFLLIQIRLLKGLKAKVADLFMKSNVGNSLIRRTEVSSDLVRIYLGYLRKSSFQDTNLKIIVVNEGESDEKIYQAKLPIKTENFFARDNNTHLELGPIFFEGKKNGGELTISKKCLGHNSRFFVQILQDDILEGETDWLQILENNKEEAKEIKEKTIAVIPCYNAKDFIHDVVMETLNFANKIVLVNDGSNDGSQEIIRNLYNQNPNRVEIINFYQNQGKGFALMAAFKHVLEHEKNKAVVTLDADAQHRPSDIPYLAREVLNGCDLVIVTRLFHLMPFRSRISNTIISVFLRLLYPNAPKDTQSGMRGFSLNFLNMSIIRF